MLSALIQALSRFPKAFDIFSYWLLATKPNVIGLVSSTLETFHCIVGENNTAGDCPIFVTVATTRFPHLRQLTFHHEAEPCETIFTHKASLDNISLLYPALKQLHTSFPFPCFFPIAHWSTLLLALRASSCLTEVCLSSVQTICLDARDILPVLCVSRNYSSNDSVLNLQPLPVSVKQYTLVPSAGALGNPWERDERHQALASQLGTIAAEVNRHLDGVEFRLLPPKPIPTISQLKQVWLELPRVHNITSR
ncbi:hypothetical protein NEOLEDRAFT_192037 [Neolentinus lepideus HHB14362 ss-1]|uniref:Uncharacterized protein n=1 Tax=Neolentinus lepideus HHB14362 ss-1 TaxID=1314782 RepID=A0A165MGW1_9AGAM|nr:hypothetical protein NEOLEDRAFT_192037 [Neolentinus lepideus HHB14362 ss-1]